MKNAPFWSLNVKCSFSPSRFPLRSICYQYACTVRTFLYASLISTNVIFSPQLCVTLARLPSSTTWDGWVRSWLSRKPGTVEVSPGASSWETRQSTCQVTCWPLSGFSVCWGWFIECFITMVCFFFFILLPCCFENIQQCSCCCCSVGFSLLPKVLLFSWDWTTYYLPVHYWLFCEKLND